MKWAEGRASYAGPRMEGSGIRYATTTDGVHVAYDVFGDGPPLVYIPHWVTHLELLQQEPAAAQVLRTLASFSKVIVFDKRGTGLSDSVPVPALPTLEAWCDDVLAVLDDSDTPAAAFLASDGGAFVAQLFAALHPSRTTSLVLFGAAARIRWADDYPAGRPNHVVEDYLRALEASWGQRDIGGDLGSPSMAGDDAYRAWRIRFQRMAVRRRNHANDANAVRYRSAIHPWQHHRSNPGTPPSWRPVVLGGTRALPRCVDPGRTIRRTGRSGSQPRIRRLHASPQPHRGIREWRDPCPGT